jgi:transposase InsO family protein
MPKGKAALAMKISRMALWKIEKKYNKYGKNGLKDHRPGRLFEPLSPKFYDEIIKEWNNYHCGARKLHSIFKKRGFTVSLRKISQVLVKEGFQKPNLKKRKPRRYKRYEWPLPNYMWHTDGHVIKAPKLKGETIQVYLDDCSRKIMGYWLGGQTTRNARMALYRAIAENEATPYILNSDHGSQFISPKRDKNGEAEHEFQETLNELGILFVPSKVRHPQTNGKCEKFFHILDTEFDERFETIDEFIEYYNNKRPSEAVDYMTPNEAYEKRL